MSNLLFQTIDQISREKGIDPQIVIHAIEDAIVVASRKHFKSNEELRGRINPESGEIDVYAIRKVVPEVTNPVREISIEEARERRVPFPGEATELDLSAILGWIDVERLVDADMDRKHATRNVLIFKLHYIDGFTPEEIAQFPGFELTASGIEVALTRLKARLRKRIGKP